MGGESEDPVLLYDGTCGLCSGTVRFILLRDDHGILRFASLQSRFAEQVLAGHPELQGIDSVVWVSRATGRVAVKSEAALQVADYLKGAWRILQLLRIVPRAVRDWGYDLVASHRHLFVRDASRCWVPPSDVRKRFLE